MSFASTLKEHINKYTIHTPNINKEPIRLPEQSAATPINKGITDTPVIIKPEISLALSGRILKAKE